MTAESHAASACMHNACMPNITIRDVPADVHAVLQQRAAAAGQSMQQYLVDVLAREASRETTREIAARWRLMAEERIARGSAHSTDVVDLIRQARDDRTEHLLEVTRGDSSD